jgi:hypothetical protein
VRTHHQLTLGICSPQAIIIIKERLIVQKTMSIVKITLTIIVAEDIARLVQEKLKLPTEERRTSK